MVRLWIVTKSRRRTWEWIVYGRRKSKRNTQTAHSRLFGGKQITNRKEEIFHQKLLFKKGKRSRCNGNRKRINEFAGRNVQKWVTCDALQVRRNQRSIQHQQQNKETCWSAAVSSGVDLLLRVCLCAGVCMRVDSSGKSRSFAIANKGGKKKSKILCYDGPRGEAQQPSTAAAAAAAAVLTSQSWINFLRCAVFPPPASSLQQSV